MRAAVPPGRHPLERLTWLALAAIALMPVLDLVALSGRERGLWRSPTPLHALALGTAALAEGLLVLVVVLGLRSPLLERILGPLDRISRAHHYGGAIAYAAALTHPLALAAASAAFSSRASARRIFDLASPSIALGWIALVVLALVVCAPFVRSLQHETQRRIHALGWFVAPGAVAHAVASRGLRWVDVVLLTLLATAAVEEARSTVMGTARYRVTSTRRLGPALLEVQLQHVSHPLRFHPGQFVFARFYDPRTRWRCREYHPFTLVSSPTEERLELIIKARGDCTRALLELTPGAMAEVRGPFGRLFPEAAPRRQVWLAGGVGIAPFLSAARSLADDASRIDLFYSTRHTEDAVHLDHLHEIASRHPSLHVHSHVDVLHGALSAEHVLADAGEGGRQAEFFIAGPMSFAEALRAGLVANHVDPGRIHQESFEYL